MKESMFTLLAQVIQENRTWITVHDTTSLVTLMARSGTELKPVRRRALTLVSKWRHGVYPKGHVWYIPEDKLDKAVRALKQKDKRFANRWRQSIITLDDAEWLVYHASNKYLNLELSEL